MDSQVNPQPDDPHIRINHQIHREILRRKFKQRQRVIIDFILTLSWGCKKSSAIIPKLKNFELCGVLRGHIRKELDELVDCHVLFWDRDMNIFQINKHFDQWKIDLVDQFNAKEMNELIKKNLEVFTPNLSKTVTKKVTELPKKESDKVTKKVTELPKMLPIKVTKKVTRLLKRLLASYQKSNCEVTKKVTITRHFFNPDADYRTPKVIIKAIIKNTNTNTSNSFGENSTNSQDENYESFYTAHHRLFGFACNPKQHETLGAYIDVDGMEEAVVINALDRAALYMRGGYNFQFILSILNSYAVAKVKSLAEAKMLDQEYDKKHTNDDYRGKQNPQRSSGYRKSPNSGKPQLPVVSESSGASKVADKEELRARRDKVRNLDGLPPMTDEEFEEWYRKRGAG